VPDVAVIGAAGYAGAIAARLLHAHPGFGLVALTARGDDVGRRLHDLYPHHRVPLVLEELDAQALGALDAAIVAYPHGAAAPVVAALRTQGVKVVDLSADFRLGNRGVYEAWYGEHGAPEFFAQSVYGLPELYREAIRTAELVANPGCYPTASLIALAPLRGRMADVVIDAKSGVSGAGRKATEATNFVAMAENTVPYGVDGHRHRPEIEQELGTEITFVPHLLPLDQGELVSAYVTLEEPLEQTELDELYAAAYSDEPFVEVVAAPPGVRDVRETNFCRVHVRADPRRHRVLAFAAIDNLWKGAASQAVQNLNLMFGQDEAAGLET
jgi:N-acetyl-gamma-glutamyl-phosphate reductase